MCFHSLEFLQAQPFPLIPGNHKPLSESKILLSLKTLDTMKPNTQDKP